VEITAATPSPHTLCLRIADDGINLSPEQLAQGLDALLSR
jgi:hypothetical protein